MKFEWETLTTDTRRAKVLGGWIVLVTKDDGTNSSSIFVSDPHYEWSIEHEEN